MILLMVADLLQHFFFFLFTIIWSKAIHLLKYPLTTPSFFPQFPIHFSLFLIPLPFTMRLSFRNTTGGYKLFFFVVHTGEVCC